MASIRTSDPAFDICCRLSDLPPELMDMVLNNLTALNLISISRTNKAYHQYIKKHSTSLAQKIATKHSRRLEQDLSRLNFKNMTILSALQTFISATGASYNNAAADEFHHSFDWMFDFAACYVRSNDQASEQLDAGFQSPEESLATMVREMLTVQIRLQAEMPVHLRGQPQIAWEKIRRRWQLRFRGLIDEWWPNYRWQAGEVEEMYAHIADYGLFGPGYSLTQPFTNHRLDPKRNVRSVWWHSEMNDCHFALVHNEHVGKAPCLGKAHIWKLRYCCKELSAKLRHAVQTRVVDSMPPLMIAALFERAELCILT